MSIWLFEQKYSWVPASEIIVCMGNCYASNTLDKDVWQTQALNISDSNYNQTYWPTVTLLLDKVFNLISKITLETLMGLLSLLNEMMTTWEHMHNVSSS